MSWSVHQFYAVDETGLVLPGAVVTVLDSNGDPATIASDDTGTSLDNPFDADANGFAVFYAQAGFYTVQVSSGGATSEFENVPIGSARGADTGTSGDEIPSVTVGDARWCKRTRAPIEIAVNSNALTAWGGFPVRATAAALITVPAAMPVGFTFDVQRATSGVVGFVLDTGDAFETTTGATTVVHISEQWGWASVMKTAAGKIAVVGQIEDGAP